MNNVLSYCGLVDARLRTSKKDLPFCKENADFIDVDARDVFRAIDKASKFKVTRVCSFAT